VAGGAILGDGRVGLILDVAEVVALSQQDPAVPTPAVAPALDAPRRRHRVA
jgi:chemotaxis protein histidine kinase CheA